MKIFQYSKNIIPEIKAFIKSITPRKKRKYAAYDTICTFDTETSVNTYDEHKNQFAYIILWQFDFNNELLIYGRDIKSYVEFINVLQDILTMNLIVYVHNLSYEFQFIKFYFTWDDVFFMTPRKVYKAKDRNVIYKDSYALSGQSLEKTVEKYPIKKAVGTWDYTKIRTPSTYLTDTELRYAFNDVISLWYYIDDMRKQYKYLQKIPMTKTGITRYNLREFLKQYYKNMPPFKTGYEYYYNTFLKHSAPDLDTYKVLQHVYWGGFTHANLFNANKILNDVRSYDICSSYPTVMLCEKFPYGYFKESCDRWEYYIKKPDYSVIAEYRFTHLKSKINMGYIPAYKVTAMTNDFIYDNGKIYKSYDYGDGILDIWLTELDLETIKNIYTYDKIQVISEQIYISKKYYLPDGFREFILEMYERKTKLKGVDGMGETYARAKADLNSLYGMTVTAPIRWNWKLDGREIVEYLKDTEENLIETAYKQKSHPVGLYQWGVYVAAYARRNLMKIIEQINNTDFVYSDTDSIKVLNGAKYENIIQNYNAEITEKLKNACKGLKHSTEPKTITGIKKPLGVYEFEFLASAFKTLRSKTYIYTDAKTGEISATVAGIDKADILNALKARAKEQHKSIYEIFDYNLYISSDEITKVTAIYNDEYNTDIVQSEKVEAESSTILMPVDFSIQGDDYYIRVINEIQGYSGVIYK